MRRYAIISDIHGNSLALASVLKDIKSHGIERIINLGDSLYGPLEPVSTAEMLMQRDILSVFGNEDKLILTPGDAEPSPTLCHVRRNLEPKHIEWLREIPATRIVDDDLFACHATPQSDTCYFFWDVCSDGAVSRSREDMCRMAKNIGCPVILCGHDHVPQSVNLQKDILVVNPGSAGLPAFRDDNPYLHVMQAGSPHARYSIVSEDNGEWSAQQVMLEYDWEAAAVMAAENGRLDWASWLRTGKASVD
ncbi:MAG: metallophosphatase family protein [candidate division WOR-3 bacterium]|nr:metallophosphatase family protein [candidate division WOR-3 bacterium]